ncbi:radical SAM family heme chaperone HemW [Couchioplanes caeruleus]|uniref:Heme chaperone HemW n=2 Tax=Couchioplanes caeruleus TaxID=56438 RepID=A0A1K0GFC5_9ACTN|nr:radical SAM family heme chaperone HemW [Couchioplanes caeruleus]OJF09540.1 coproporphyrinogen III oxidase [Couchioplanes caeruleus subsp. caeruleus]ROP29606.1 oxygen-independent coproporphyrinogen-3 oxidase [Couchioplanes caeruleus]
MPGPLPDGEPVPADGSLPAPALREAGRHGFGVYVHVPFCASRCGYCDFNTYTASELGGGASRDEYADTVLRELELAGGILRARVDTVFVGGGTPTLLDPADLGRILEGIDRIWGLAADAEITTEANPESVTPASLQALRKAGYNRISLGMQSASPGVLAILDRRHTAGRAPRAAEEAREAGFDHVNLDLIYGTPGETADDFAASLDAVIGAGVDHVSAYSLIVEDGTRIAARMRRGELPYPEDDVAADRYLAAERALSAAGFSWYEVSNWATSEEARCRHNRLYWTGGDWWGLGPGAHSHVGGVRWWNVKHPSAYAKRLADGVSPGLGREVLTGEDRRIEEVMLRLRLAEGLPLGLAREDGARRALADGLLEPIPYGRGRAVLTLRGRLLADAVIRDLV